MKWAKKDTWGSWHPGPEAHTKCPQCDRWHKLDEAIHLNDQVSVWRQATLHGNMRRWRES